MELTWLDAEREVDEKDVGPRARAMARLRTAHLPALRGVAMGRTLQGWVASQIGKETGALGKLPTELSDALVRALRQLGGPWAVRRSSLDDPTVRSSAAPKRNRRITVPPAVHEPYLHILDVADVLEAVRRVWERAFRSNTHVAVIIQKFVTPDASARVRDHGRDEILIEASYGVGDLLASGLVVPDRYLVARTGTVIRSRQMGRKSQMTIPSSDGGLVRVPVPVASARELALSDELAQQIARHWCDAEAAIGRLDNMSLAVVGPKASITTVTPSSVADYSDDGPMLG